MSESGWEHIVLAAIAAIPATIAAVSSVQNGKELKRGRRSTQRFVPLDISGARRAASGTAIQPPTSTKIGQDK